MRDLEGRHFIVTGSNTGVGRATAEALGARGATVWLACRTEAKAQPVADAIVKSGGKAHFVRLDLSDPAVVRSAAKTLLDDGGPLHVLINNAGMAGPRGLTKEGFEITFATNHLGPFLFTLLLLPKLSAAPGARIVNVASKAHYPVKRLDWDALRRPTESRMAFGEYQVSKLCNILFTRELARRVPGVSCYAVHPGVVASDLWRSLPGPLAFAAKLVMISNEEGALTSLHCATAPEVAGQSGLYYDKCRAREPSALAKDDGLARELWRRSIEWTGASDVG